mmetsp:Transcript_10699/g.39612  ORF Transcript_10699/g.39612 Transcript_10699/m.39612 type:complete len:445 (+) Transcript_10699:75-1409(+)
MRTRTPRKFLEPRDTIWEVWSVTAHTFTPPPSLHRFSRARKKSWPHPPFPSPRFRPPPPARRSRRGSWPRRWLRKSCVARALVMWEGRWRVRRTPRWVFTSYRPRKRSTMSRSRWLASTFQPRSRPPPRFQWSRRLWRSNSVRTESPIRVPPRRMLQEHTYRKKNRDPTNHATRVTRDTRVGCRPRNRRKAKPSKLAKKETSTNHLAIGNRTIRPKKPLQTRYRYIPGERNRTRKNRICGGGRFSRTAIRSSGTCWPSCAWRRAGSRTTKSATTGAARRGWRTRTKLSALVMRGRLICPLTKQIWRKRSCKRRYQTGGWTSPPNRRRARYRPPRRTKRRVWCAGPRKTKRRSCFAILVLKGVILRVWVCRACRKGTGSAWTAGVTPRRYRRRRRARAVKKRGKIKRTRVLKKVTPRPRPRRFRFSRWRTSSPPPPIGATELRYS